MADDERLREVVRRLLAAYYDGDVPDDRAVSERMKELDAIMKDS